MAEIDSKQLIKALVGLGGVILGAYVVMKAIEKNSISKGFDEGIKKVNEISKEVIKEPKKLYKRFVKGSQEAKDYMASLRAKQDPNKKSKSKKDKKGGFDWLW